MADDELEHVLFEDSDEVPNIPQTVQQDQPGLMYARPTMRRLVVLKLRVVALTGRTLNLQQAVLSLLQLTKMCQMTIFIASYTIRLLLPVQHQNHRQVPCQRQLCRNSLLLHRLLAKVTLQPTRHAFCMQHKLPAHLELSHTAMLILDPAEVLAQQQKAAANRSPAAANLAPSVAQNAAVVSKGAPQHIAQMPGHATNMMYRPVASAAPIQPAMTAAQGPGKPSLLNNRAHFMSNIQLLLAFADIRWKETNQTEKRKAARKLVQDVKQACGTAAVYKIYMPCCYLLCRHQSSHLNVCAILVVIRTCSCCRIPARLSFSSRGSCASLGMN